jgi:hypothetical protein
MTALEARVASGSNWLATSAYAYTTFVASMRPVTTVVRWAAALIAASVAYVLIMLLLAVTWQHDPAHAAICCAGSMAVAVLCGAWVAGLILLPRHRSVGMWTCTALGMMYPLLLAAGHAPGTPVREMQLLYVVTAAAGGIAAHWALRPTRRGPVPYTARA